MWAEIGVWIVSAWAKLKSLRQSGGSGQSAIGIANRQASASATGDYSVAMAVHGGTVNLSHPVERKENQVNVTIGIDTKNIFFADVYNSGDTIIYIKSVSLCGTNEPSESLQFTLLPTTAVAAGPGPPEYIILSNAPDRALSPRMDVRFQALRMSRVDFDKLLAYPEETIHLSIRVFQGEIHRVEGAGLLTPLRSLAAQLKSIQEEDERRISREFMEGTFRPLDF